MNNKVFLDGLSLTFKNVVQSINCEIIAIDQVSQKLGGTMVKRNSGGKGYPLSCQIVGYLDGEEWSIFCGYGSRNVGQHLHMEAKGRITELFRDVVLELGFTWSLSRADIALDMITDYDDGHKICKEYAMAKNIKTSLVGDWEGKEAGRTYYIGANRSNEIYIRFYEKGKEMLAKGFTDVPDGLCRLEVEIKPRKEKRQQLDSLDASYLLSTVRNPLELFNSFADLGIDSLSINAKRDSSYIIGLNHMLAQYNRTLREYVDNHGLASLIKRIKCSIQLGQV